MRLELHCGAGAVGEFFDRHPGPGRLARADLTNDLKKQLCEADPPLGPCDFQRRSSTSQYGRARSWRPRAGDGPRARWLLQLVQ